MNKNRYHFITLVLSMLAAMTVLSAESPAGNIFGTKFIRQGELIFLRKGAPPLPIAIEIADTDAKTAQGLMYRRTMEMTNGMLFIFRDEDERSFWMKNTILTLDIIFVNASMEIIHIHQFAKPFSTDPIPSRGKAKYVVEVNGGFSAEQRIGRGDKIRFTRDSVRSKTAK